MFNYCDDVQALKKRWTKFEDKKLTDLIIKRYPRDRSIKNMNWKAIAEQLGTNRTDQTCYRRYKTLRAMKKVFYYPQNIDNMIVTTMLCI